MTHWLWRLACHLWRALYWLFRAPLAVARFVELAAWAAWRDVFEES